MYIILSYVDLLLFLCYIHYIILIIIYMYCIIFSFITLRRVYYWISTRVGLKNNNRKAEKIMDTPAINYSTRSTYIFYKI